MEVGYLYVCDAPKWAREVLYAATRLRETTNFPICVICSEEFDDLTLLRNTIPNVILKLAPEMHKQNFITKVIGMLETPFERTLFMDSDTYVCDSVDDLFDLFDYQFDMALCQHEGIHSNLFILPDQYYLVFPEYNTGVILYKKSDVVFNFLTEWKYNMCNHIYSKEYFDMPQFRSTLLHTKNRPSIFTLSKNYNLYGLRSFQIIHNKVKIIHERFGYHRFSFSEKMLENKRMNKIALRMNKSESKRIFIPYFNILLNAKRWSIDYLIRKFKEVLGFKKISKRTVI